MSDKFQDLCLNDFCVPPPLHSTLHNVLVTGLRGFLFFHGLVTDRFGRVECSPPEAKLSFCIIIKLDNYLYYNLWLAKFIKSVSFVT